MGDPVKKSMSVMLAILVVIVVSAGSAWYLNSFKQYTGAQYVLYGNVGASNAGNNTVFVWAHYCGNGSDEHGFVKLLPGESKIIPECKFLIYEKPVSTIFEMKGFREDSTTIIGLNFVTTPVPSTIESVKLPGEKHINGFYRSVVYETSTYAYAGGTRWAFSISNNTLYAIKYLPGTEPIPIMKYKGVENPNELLGYDVYYNRIANNRISSMLKDAFEVQPVNLKYTFTEPTEYRFVVPYWVWIILVLPVIIGVAVAALLLHQKEKDTIIKTVALVAIIVGFIPLALAWAGEIGVPHVAVGEYKNVNVPAVIPYNVLVENYTTTKPIQSYTEVTKEYLVADKPLTIYMPPGKITVTYNNGTFAAMAGSLFTRTTGGTWLLYYANPSHNGWDIGANTLIFHGDKNDFTIIAKMAGTPSGTETYSIENYHVEFIANVQVMVTKNATSTPR